MSTTRFAALKALAAGLVMLLGLAGTVTSASAAAAIVIVNNDGANEGFNDATPVAPVGGNTGTNLGQQRLNAFQHAAGIWGATLTSNVTIQVRANFDPLACTATSAVLGSAGPLSVSRDFTNAPLAGTWYHASPPSRGHAAQSSASSHVPSAHPAAQGSP